MKSEILNHFDRRNGRKPRAEQAQALLEIEAGWDSHDIFVLNVPTGAGKTLISDCIAQWQAASGKRCHLVVPDNMLLAQAEVECAKEAAVMKAQRFYECTWKGLDDKPVKGTRATCPYKSCKKKFTDGCPYMRSLKKWQKSNVRISNYWLVAAHKMVDKCDVYIMDEAHKFTSYLASLCAKRIWHREMAFPLEAQTYIQIKNWCQHALEQLDHVDKGHPKMNLKIELQILWQELTSDVGKYTVTSTYADYRGHPEPCIELRPIEVRDALPLAVNRKTTKKMVLLSATFSKWDLKELGLENNRVLYVNVGSPIPVDRRPVYIKPVLSNRVQDGYRDLDELLKVLTVLQSKFPTDKGIVHLTYSMAREMQRRKIPEELRARLIFHTASDKLAQLEKFYASSNGIFIGAGVTEGLDLKHDLARFNVIAKIPWASLVDPVVARKSEEDPMIYSWWAARSVMQAAGRVSRSADDYGQTWILDSSFNRIPKEQLLQWFTDACIYL
jgi:Rad3-related DNA helicase